ncbi:MAG: discoidin domain-containing protein [Alloprevotella sp.]
MKHSTFLFGLLAAILSLLSVQTAQAGDKLTISSASASISHYTGGGSSYPVSNVFDGSTSTKYWSNGPQTSSTYVQVVLAEESNIGSVKLYFCSGDQPNGGTISYSTDGSTWTNAKTFAKSEITGSNYLYSCDIDGAPLAKYVRLTLTSPNTSQWFQLSEFEVYGPSENQVSVTFHYDAGGTYQFDVEKTYVIGTTLTLAEVSDLTYFKDFAFNTEDLTVSEENKVFTVTCTPDFPFTEGHVYKMHGANYDGDQQRVNASNYCFTARTDNNITYQGVKDAIDANSYWIFEHVAGTQDQFYVYNMGVGKYLSSKTSRQPAIMAEKGSADGANQIFRITPNGDGFNLQHQGDTNCCGTHINGRGENPYLGTAWGNSGDPSHDASRVYVMDIAPELAALGNDPATTEGYVGEGPSQVLKTAAAAAGATPTKANVVACLDAYNNPKLADYVAADKYYQIFFEGSDGTNQALALNAATETYSAGAFTLVPGTVIAVAESGIGQTDNIASIYQFTKGTSGMLVTNVNAQAAWGTVSASGLEGTTGEGTEYPFAVASGQSNNSYWNIVTENGHLVLDGTAVRNSTSEAATARLKEVTSIPVTIKSTLWTSLCFPVDVVIPANLKAYKAASTQGMTINLDELTAGSRIPAGTGFLALAEAGGSYSFAIATGSEAAADLSDNQFTGAKVKRSGMADVDYFALATKNTVTGFYKVTTGTVPANKAYLLGEKLNQGAGANMLQFAFGEGTETGISNVNAENSGKAETYYDLNGRLVVYPTRGVYVTGSGRKVFVK